MTNKITFKLEDTDRKRDVELSIYSEGLTLQELFTFWVDFASGCGYYIDRSEMEELWAGDTDRELSEAYDAHLETETKLAKAIEALEGVKSFADDLYPSRGEGAALVPRLAKAVKVLAELKGQADA
jgi:hypothetical protein